jgi:hypothetical protein
MRFGSPEYFRQLEALQERSPISGVNRARHSSIEIGGALGFIRVTFDSKLSPQLRRAIARGFFRHNKEWLRYFRSITLRHAEHVSFDPHRFTERGLPLFEGKSFGDLAGRLGFEIQLARLNLGLSQAQLSQRTGIPQGYISQIERGLVNIRKDTHQRILRAMMTRRSLTAEDYLLCE